MIKDTFSFSKGIDDSLIEKLSEKLNTILKDYELNDFMLGCSFLKEVPGEEKSAEEQEEEKKELRKNFQFPLAQKVKDFLGITIDYENPDAIINIDFNTRIITIWLKSVYILGRYKKFSRKISQTLFYCPKCKGRGCENCSFKGVLPFESVQELIAKEALPLFGAKSNSFHGSGREDLNVKMLGNGRQFVLELKDPQKRTLDLKELENRINEVNKEKIAVVDLELCKKEKVAQIKEEKHEKTYSFIAESEEEITKEALDKLTSYINKELVIFQRTPKRVSKSRADLVRRKKGTLLRIDKLSENSLGVDFKAEHGLYIKEFVSNDSERTKPSFSSLAEISLTCKDLDVIEIF